MLPFIKSLTSIDTYRDGGSMSISFISLTGIEHTLLFPLRNSPSNNGSTKAYAEPVLEIYRKAKRVSSVTGLISYDTHCEKKQLKWHHSLRLLHRAKKHVASFQSDYIENFPVMLAIAQNQGVLGHAT